jgi:hypothetical protein
MDKEFVWTDQNLRELLVSVTGYYDDKHWNKTILDFKVMKHPKPEWEILEGTSGDATQIHDWKSEEEVEMFGGQTCQSHQCKIWKIKRLSDGAVFTVGDYMVVQSGLVKEIDKFEIGENGQNMCVWSGATGFGLKFIAKLCGQMPKVPKEFGDYSPVYLTPFQIEKLHKILNKE